MYVSLLAHWNLQAADADLQEQTDGRRNRSWRMTLRNQQGYVLEKIEPSLQELVWRSLHNQQIVRRYLKTNHPDFLWVAPLEGRNGHVLVKRETAYYRLFPVVPGSQYLRPPFTAAQLFAAARQFALLTKTLQPVCSELEITQPGLHQLLPLYELLEERLLKWPDMKMRKAKDTISFLQHCFFIADTQQQLQQSPLWLPQRMSYGHASVGDVLFDKRAQPLCVAPGDALQSGFFFSDAGCLIKECYESNHNASSSFGERYRAMADGYLSIMDAELTGMEKKYFYFSVLIITCTQALEALLQYLSSADATDELLMHAEQHCRSLQFFLHQEATLHSYVR
jgi:hypothetical protein